MNISTTATLSEPTGSARIPLSTLGYIRARSKLRAYNLVLTELEKFGVSQADLARRLGKNPAQICRSLAGPGNWTLDTLSDLLFAISGAEPDYDSVVYPLRAAARNDTIPAWLTTAPYHPQPPSTSEPIVSPAPAGTDFWRSQSHLPNLPRNVSNPLMELASRES